MATKEKKQRQIFFIQGGAGDVLAHTPMIRSFRNKHPNDEIVVLSTYAQLWEGNTNVDIVAATKELEDVYQTYVLSYGQDNVRFFKKHFIYDAIFDDPANGAANLPEFICNVYGTEYDGKPLDYTIGEKEKKNINTFLGQYRNLNKPIVLVHCTGAIPSDGNFNKTNNLKDADVKKISELVKKYNEQCIFIQIGLQGEPLVEGAIDTLGMPMREAIALIPHCTTFIFIESLFMHCSDALQKSGVVIFQNTSPKFFGYAHNLNFGSGCGCESWPCNRPVGALLDVLPGYRNPKTREKLLWECPEQKCKEWTVADLDKAFQEAMLKNAPAQGQPKGNPMLDLARQQKPMALTTEQLTQRQLGTV
jgi:ADP-heptose:LPS heptosyltransferase